MNKQEVLEAILERKIVAIFRGIDPERCSEAANALYAGGVAICEVTFDQNEVEGGYASTVNSIKNILAGKGDRAIFCGAGTVLTCEQVVLAYNAGASFIITPNTDPEVIDLANSLGMVTMPGAFSATEAVIAYQAGADFVKIFPAVIGGPAYIKAIRGPLSHIPFTAVGGVDEKNAKSFLDAGCVGLGIGGNLVSKKLISEGKYDELTALARTYVDAIS